MTNDGGRNYDDKDDHEDDDPTDDDYDSFLLLFLPMCVKGLGPYWQIFHFKRFHLFKQLRRRNCNIQQTIQS